MRLGLLILGVEKGRGSEPHALKELLATAATSSSTLSSQNMRSCAGTNTVNEGGGRGR